MYHVGILYSPYDDLHRSIVDIIRENIDSGKYDTRVKRAEEAVMPDIAASDIIILVSSDSEDYKEIIRALKGINLSGRLAGIVAFNSEKIKHIFEDALKYTGAVCYGEILNIRENSIESDKIKKWTKGLLQEYERIIYER
ncbi:MAG: hypothetical protein DRP57_12305 [Spirochaetes bacterium]|nr:MAG: hypothetical protein DRP57_12305 [Spirochaetota bacterium]